MFRILESEKQIVDKIAKAIAEDYNKTIISSIPEIQTKVKDLTRLFFRTTDTYQALGEELEGHFGFPAGTGHIRADWIVKSVIDSLVVKNTPVKSVGSNLVGSLHIKMLHTTLIEPFNLPSDIINVENKDQLLPWMRWLLLFGDDIIISEHEIKFGTNLPGSRSGQALMVESAGVWRVPPQYAGTIRDNWLTRTLLSKPYLRLLNLAVRSIILKNVK